MQLFDGRPTALISRFFASNLAKVLGIIAAETIVTVSMQVALSVVHIGFRYTAGSPLYLAIVAAVHEAVFLGMYVLLAYKALKRLAKL